MKFIQKLSYACFNILCILFFCFFSFLGIKIEAYSIIEAIIPVSCLEILDSAPHTYEIVIEAENNISPQPKSNILTINDDGIGEFIIEITEPGTYVYKIYEKSGTDMNITYDSTIYYVTVFVVNTDKNDLIYSVSANISGNSSKCDKVLFKDVVLGNKIVSTTNITDISQEMTVTTNTTNTTVTTVTENIDITVVSSTSLNDDDTNNINNTSINDTNDTNKTNDTITNLIDSVVTGDFTPIKLLFIIIGISVIIAFIMTKIKKENERRQ